MSEDYDPRTCITAGECRAMGGEVPTDIPDCAWVPRRALKLDSVMADVTEADRKARALPSFKVTLTITEPFRWVEINRTIDLSEDL